MYVYVLMYVCCKYIVCLYRAQLKNSLLMLFPWLNNLKKKIKMRCVLGLTLPQMGEVSLPHKWVWQGKIIIVKYKNSYVEIIYVYIN